jgi:RHS repeat-associated protein
MVKVTQVLQRGNIVVYRLSTFLAILAAAEAPVNAFVVGDLGDKSLSASRRAETLPSTLSTENLPIKSSVFCTVPGNVVSLKRCTFGEGISVVRSDGTVTDSRVIDAVKSFTTLDVNQRLRRKKLLRSDTKCSAKSEDENSALKINYPGSGNNSQFTYDSYGHTVAIVETVASTVTGTKLFVWTKDKMWQSRPCESRNSSGTVTAQYFNCGEEINGTNYFWTFDHIGSVREMTNSVGTIVDQRSYDAFGRVTQLQGSTASDFQFGGYYYHAPSGLSLATFRAYSSHLGRWINRDPISERGGINLYAYVENDPILKKDSLGLDSLGFALEGWNDVWAIGWVNSLIGLGLSYGASSNAKSSKLPGPNNGPQDAYRHCLWSCMMAGYMGPLAAKVAGDNHEGDNGEGAPRNAANAMDAANNAAGRAAAAGGGDCACKCRGLLGSGGLVGTNGMPMTPKGMTFLTPGFQGGKEQ